MQTTVYQLGDDGVLLFSLPPDIAVVAAFELSRGNANTWLWPVPADHLHYRRGRFGHHCGDFSAPDSTPTA